MSATAKKRNPTKKRPASHAASLPPLPPEARVMNLDGRQYFISPVDAYDDWLQDAMLSAIASDRLRRQEGTVSLEEFEIRQAAKKKRR